VERDLTRLGSAAFTDPYYQVGLRMVHQDAVVVAGIADLEFKPSLAAPPVDISESLIRDNNVFPSVTTAQTFEEAYRRLSLFTVWAIVGDEYALTLITQADENIVPVAARYRPRNRAMAVPALDTDFHALVNFTIQDMASDGTLARLQEAYFGPYIPPDEQLEVFDVIDIWPGDGSYLGVGG
jgi:ABC-type amino acid transport substrate-binding protein